MIFPFCTIKVMGFIIIIHKKGFGLNGKDILNSETKYTIIVSIIYETRTTS